MQDVFLTILPIIAVALLGYLAVRFNYISQAVADGLSRFVIAVAIPLFVFRYSFENGRTLEQHLGLAWPMLTIYFVGALGAMVAGLFVARSMAGDGSPNLIAAAASHSNVMHLALPTVVLLLGSGFRIPLVIILGLHGLLMAVIATVVNDVRKGSAGNIPQSLGRVVSKQIKNPILIALVLGLVLKEVGLTMPADVGKVVYLISDATAPCALFALGGILAKYALGGNMQGAFVASALKLAVHPLIVWALGTYVLNVRATWMWLAILVAAMPVALGVGNTQGGDNNNSGGTIVLLSTILSIASITAVRYYWP
ncbi:MAG: AEC family transporter [Inquilinus sp.]|nr:AEC family transporter [Inquilinus sp.]